MRRAHKTRCDTYDDALQSYVNQGILTARYRPRTILHQEASGAIVMTYRQDILLECDPSGQMVLHFTTPARAAVSLRHLATARRRVLAAACAWYLGGRCSEALDDVAILRLPLGDTVVHSPFRTWSVWPSTDGQTLSQRPPECIPFTIVTPNRDQLRAVQHRAGLTQWRRWWNAYRHLATSPPPDAVRSYRGMSWHVRPSGRLSTGVTYPTGGLLTTGLPEQLADRTQWPALAQQYGAALDPLVTAELCRREPTCLHRETLYEIPLAQWSARRRQIQRTHATYGWVGEPVRP